MPSHHQQDFLPYSPEQLFDLVADVGRYPEFLPWCRAARVLSRSEGEMVAELVISYHHLSERYTSRVLLQRPDAIHVSLLQGPFAHLNNAWRFDAVQGGTQIDFSLDFAFKSKILDKMLGGFFYKATQKMVQAFRSRADALYHASTPSDIQAPSA